MFNKKLIELRKNSGFTMIEVLVVLAIIIILAGVGIPAFSRWLPNYRLKSAATDIFSNMQLAKMEAIKANETVEINFAAGPPGQYVLQYSSAVTPFKTVDFNDYDDSGNIAWGWGNATKNISGNPFGGSPITYTGNKLSFNPRGTGKMGTVYIQNQKGKTYAIGTLLSGVIRLRKWNESSGDWE